MRFACCSHEKCICSFPSIGLRTSSLSFQWHFQNPASHLDSNLGIAHFASTALQVWECFFWALDVSNSKFFFVIVVLFWSEPASIYYSNVVFIFGADSHSLDSAAKADAEPNQGVFFKKEKPHNNIIFTRLHWRSKAAAVTDSVPEWHLPKGASCQGLLQPPPGASKEEIVEAWGENESGSSAFWSGWRLLFINKSCRVCLNSF